MGEPHGLSRRAVLARAGAAGAGLAVAGALPWWSRAAAQVADPWAARLRELDAATRGPVLLPGTASFTQAARLFATQYDGVLPRAILKAWGSDDVAAGLRWAARYGSAVRARAGGHSYAGYSTVAGGLVIDLRPIAGVSVGSSGTASIGAGALLADVYDAVTRAGRVVPGGTCPSVGVSGLTLGGGYGMAGRRYGLLSDSLVSADVVTPDGRVRTVDATRDPDLFWAIRGGGGGNFGVTTRFRLRTYAQASGVAYSLAYPWSRMAEVVDGWQRWVADAPPALASVCTPRTGTPSPQVLVYGQYNGPESELRTLLSALRSRVGAPGSTTVQTQSYMDLVKRWAGCADLTVSQCHWTGVTPDGRLSRVAFAATSSFTSALLSSAAIATIKALVEERQAAGATGRVALDAWGGALGTPAPDATAFVHRTALLLIQNYAQWSSAAQQAAGVAWVRGARDALAPYGSGEAYQNYIDPTQPDWQRAYYGANLPRLVDVQRRYDPDGVLRFPQSIGA